MMNAKLLQLAVLAVWLALHSFAAAQSRSTPDHPSHRYLPPPSGKQTLTDQIKSLEQLSQAVSSGQASSAPSKLSPEQLAQLDALLESFRDEKGELRVPSPDAVPKEWIDNLLPDPKQRQQAKEMLEEYSRTRNLNLKPDRPSPPTSSPADANEDSPAPTNRPGNNTLNNTLNPRDNRNRSTRQANEPADPALDPAANPAGNPATNRTNGTPSNQRNNQTDGQTDGQGGMPPATSPELRKLYETLKQFQQQRAQQEALNNARAATDANGSPSPGSSSSPSPNRRSTGPSTRDSNSSNSANSANGNRSNRTGGTARSNSSQPNRAQRVPASERPRSAATPPNEPGPGTVAPPGGLDSSDKNGATRPSQVDANGPSRPNDPADPKPPTAQDANGQLSNPTAKPGESAQAKPADKPELTPFDEGFDFSKDQEVPINPFVDPPAQAPASRPHSAASAGTFSSEADGRSAPVHAVDSASATDHRWLRLELRQTGSPSGRSTRPAASARAHRAEDHRREATER